MTTERGATEAGSAEAGTAVAAGGGPPSRPSESYSARAWRKLRGHPSGMTGLVVVILLALLAMFAPLLANDRPIIAEYKDELVFPAFTTYVDAWVPWQSLRYDLKSLEVGAGYFPFGDYYASLEDKTWKDVRESPEMSFSVWPLVEWSPTQFDRDALKLPPDLNGPHLLGTDDQGRDVLARLLHGSVVAMLVGLVAQGIATSIGASLGILAGFKGGVIDLVLSRICEIVMCFPTFFLIIAVTAFLEPSIINIMVALGLVGWTNVFRLVRGEVLKTRGLEYVTAARALGMGSWRIMTRHVLPNSVAPVFVAVPFGIAAAVLTETSLSFLGFGDPNVPSWGEIVQQGRNYVSQGLWHLTLFPGLCIFVTLTGFNLLGQGLRDALDPRLRT